MSQWSTYRNPGGLGLLFYFFSMRGLAQVPVREEPMHHCVFDNGRIRLLDVHISPGDTSAFHIHATPSVFVILHPVRTGSEIRQQEDQKQYPVERFENIYFEGFYHLARVHRVWNEDTAEFHVMDIELPGKAPFANAGVVTDAAFHYLFDQIPVRVYRVLLNPGRRVDLPARPSGMLFIVLDQSNELLEVNGKKLSNQGDWAYIAPGVRISAANRRASMARLACLEVK